jgi:hypothetical protein
MSSHNKNKVDLDSFIHFLNNKCEENMEEKEKEKEKKEKFISIDIPDSNSYSLLVHKKYNLQQLKTIAKTYKLKQSGNKNELLFRIYYYLLFSSKVIQIQKLYRGHLQRRYNQYHGPAFIKRDLCTNANDFLSIEDIQTLP